MTYATQEVSIQGGRPYFLYTFTKGATINRFTSSAQDVEYLSNTYTASPIRHEGINTSGDVERVQMNIYFPKSNSFAQTYFSPDYSDVITLTILRGHYGADDTQVMWKGRVINYEAMFDEIKIVCESIQTTTRRNGLRAKYERTCRHALYGDGCGLNIEDFYTTATVDSISELDVTVSVASADEQIDGYYTGGILEKDGNFAFIRKDVSNVLTMQYLIDGLTAGDTVRIAPGCNLNKGTCVSKFNNIVNFGGFPFIPKKNPFGGNAGTRVDK